MKIVATILHLITYWSLLFLVVTPSNIPNQNMTGKEISIRSVRQPDLGKISIKHSIIYHIVKRVKAIESDIFVSRKIDLTPMVNGINEIAESGIKVTTLCREIPNIIKGVKERTQKKIKSEPKFRYIKKAEKTSHTEARQRCLALGYRLPEIYNQEEFDELKTFMTEYRILTAHAGIYFDQEFSVHRFYSTGMPSWQAYQTELYQWEPSASGSLKPASWLTIQDDPEVTFFYSIKGHLIIRREINLVSKGYFRRNNVRESYKELEEFSAEVICQTKWDGDNVAPSQRTRTTIAGLRSLMTGFEDARVRNLTEYRRQKKRHILGMPSVSKVDEMSLLEQHCYSIAAHMSEVKERSNTRLMGLLALIEVSIDTQTARRKRQFNESESEPVSNRTTRGLPSFLFMNGVRSIWGLLGFIEKIRTNRRLNKLEDIANAHSQSIDKLSKEIQTHSIAIQQLQVSTQDLIQRVQDLTERVTKLEQRINTLETEAKLQQIFDLIGSLIGRSEEALNYGFTKLEDIIHSALIGHTSAFLLPPEKLQEVQTMLNRESTAIVDSEYKHMKSIIVSDPDRDSLKLLAIVNLAALSRNSKELVKLIPLPTFHGTSTLIPVLNYNTVVLDQEGGTFIIVEEDEVQGCLRDHCVTSNPEISTATMSCGIPQYFGRHLNLCQFEETISNGIFLKRMGLDGVVFNVREEVTAQIFCAKQIYSKAHQIKQSGIVSLPAGCTFSITTMDGKKTTIKALPVAKLIEFKELEIIIGGPEQIFKQSGKETLSNGTSVLKQLLNDHLDNISAQINGTSEAINSNKFYVILLASLLGVLALATLIAGMVFYRYSSRFRTKVTTLKQELHEGLKSTMGRITSAESRLTSSPGPRVPDRPPVPPHNIESLLRKLEELEVKILQSDTYLNMQEQNKEQLYQNISEVHYTRTPQVKPKIYPPLAPSLEDIEQTKSLLNKVNPIPPA